MLCVAIRHVAFEDLGVWEPEIRAHGYEVRYADAGIVGLVDVAVADLVVVLGGPIGVADAERYPVLVDEIDALHARLERDAPVLGVCLGAQLLASAAGAKVYRGETEIGWGRVDLTAAGRTGPLRHLDGVDVLHWHGDTFDVPRGARLLASTPATPHQAFSVGRSLGVQFHPEADGSRIEAWLVGHAHELSHKGVDVAALRSASAAAAAASELAGILMVREYLRGLL